MLYRIISIISYYIIDLKGQNRLIVGTDEPKLKVKMQSVSDDVCGKDFLKSHVLSSSFTQFVNKRIGMKCRH